MDFLISSRPNGAALFCFVNDVRCQPLQLHHIRAHNLDCCCFFNPYKRCLYIVASAARKRYVSMDIREPGHFTCKSSVAVNDKLVSLALRSLPDYVYVNSALFVVCFKREVIGVSRFDLGNTVGVFVALVKVELMLTLTGLAFVAVIITAAVVRGFIPR